MKKDNEGNELTFERVLDMGNGMAVYKVHVERCKEQDKNAQVMDKATFNRLKETIAEDGRLESMPYGYIGKNRNDNPEFFIISGHHRIRAARMAEVTEIFVMADETELDRDTIVSKQLAHNALTGESDAQVLKELYDSIQDVQAKIRSGITEVDLDKSKYRPVEIEDVSLDYDFKIVKFLFLNHGMENFDRMLDRLEKEDRVYLADKADFDRYAETLRKLSATENIRNIASLMGRMVEIVNDYCDVTLRNGEDASLKEGDKKPKVQRRPIGFKNSTLKVSEEFDVPAAPVVTKLEK